MSATLNASVFADYFRAFDPYLAEIPGRAHPVQAFFLEDALALTGLRVDARDECAVGSFRSKRNSRSSQKSSFVGLTKRDWASKLKDYPDEVHSSLSALDPACVNYSLIVRVVEAIFTRNSDAWARHCFESVKDDEDGAILVFVTGLAEITATVEKLRMSEVLEGRSVIHALHSQLSTQDQQAIFRRAPPGSRKIVVSTNIAETSITIDDVGDAAPQRKTPSTRPPRRSCTSWTPRASRRTATTRTAASRRWKRSSCRRRPRGSGGAARAACGRAWPSTS
jgi:ATP-dependent RNA helicase DHX57